MKLTLTIETDDEASVQEAINLLAVLTGGAPEQGEDQSATKTKRKPAEKKTTAKKEEPKEPTVSKEDVRKALQSRAALDGRQASLDILRDTGKADTIDDLSEDMYQKVIDACEAE